MFEIFKLTSIKSSHWKIPQNTKISFQNFKLKFEIEISFLLKIDFSFVTKFLVTKITQNRFWTLGLKIIKPPPLNPSHWRLFNNTNKHSQTSLT
jgi:hypothetical protein